MTTLAPLPVSRTAPGDAQRLRALLERGLPLTERPGRCWPSSAA